MKLILQIALGIVLGALFLVLINIALLAGMLKGVSDYLEKAKPPAIEIQQQIKPNPQPIAPPQRILYSPPAYPNGAQKPPVIIQPPPTQQTQPIKPIQKIQPIVNISRNNEPTKVENKPIARNPYFRPPSHCEAFRDHWETFKNCVDEEFGTAHAWE